MHKKETSGLIESCGTKLIVLVCSAHFKYFKKENISENVVMQNQLEFPESQKSIF